MALLGWSPFLCFCVCLLPFIRFVIYNPYSYSIHLSV